MKCGFYESDITPPLGVTMYGYAVGRVASGVRSKLYAKAAVIENNGTMVALLSIDAEQMPHGLSEIVRKRVNEKTGIDENAILIAATHSHTGGPVRADGGNFRNEEVRAVNNQPELDTELDRKVLEITSLLAADAVVLAWQRLKPAHIRFGEGRVEGISFVRQYYLKDGNIRSNPPLKEVVKPYSEPDIRLPVLYFTDEDEKPMGLITSFALHHDSSTDKISDSELCADYSGYASQHLKRKLGENFVSVFFSGFCGNINHFNYMGKILNNEPFTRPAPENGRIVAEALLKTIEKAEKVPEKFLAVKKDTVRIKKRELEPEFLESVKELVKNPPDLMVKNTIADPNSDFRKFLFSKKILALYVGDETKEYDIPVQVIKIGDCLVYSFAGEIFSQFGDKIRKYSPSRKNIMVEMAHTSKFAGYVPVPELFLPYVYESSPISGNLEPAAGDKMVEKAIEIAKEIF